MARLGTSWKAFVGAWAIATNGAVGARQLVRTGSHNILQETTTASSNTGQPRTLVATDPLSCCTFDYETCGDSDWCNESQSNCGQCNGEWKDLTAPPVAYSHCCTWDNQDCGESAFCNAKASYCEGSCGGTWMHVFCCSWNGKDCGSTEWCNTSDQNCSQCGGGRWIDTQLASSTCTARWQSCTDSSTCCNDMVCVQFDGYTGCGWQGIDGTPIGSIPSPPTSSPTKNPTEAPTTEPTFIPAASPTKSPTRAPTLSPTVKPTDSPTKTPAANSGDTCCSWNFKTCGEDAWCNESDDNCGQCNGFWVDTSRTDMCTARWQSCPDSSSCCEGIVCIQFDGYTGCGIAGTDGPEVDGGPNPSPVTPNPTGLPTMYPTNTELVPTPPPVTSPSPPSGSFISPGYSEFITIPQPPIPPFIGAPETHCPHSDFDLLDWESDLSLTPSDDGQDVVLPENTRVVVRASVTRAIGTLTIPASSELILSKADNGGIEMTLGGMIVQGKLVAGSESCLIDTPVVLTFTGSRPADATTNVPAPSVKGIDVQGGTISLHGKRFYRTWTRLSRTIEAGDTVLMLQDSTNWEVGQEIVLVTTAMKDARDWHENEILVIAEILSTLETGSSIRVSTPVQQRHVATPNYQAEVGLLTRSIKIQGSESDSEPTDPDLGGCSKPSQEWAQYGDPSQPCMDKGLTGYGAHVMVRDGGKGYIEGVEFFRVGQTNVLGRYPMHFHLLGDCDDCYLRASSIHRSYYRCISIHATNRATVTENVAYDVSGFCYYLEDGVETGNTISFNLAAFIHMIGPDIPSGGGQTTATYKQSTTLTLPADVTASGYYISNIQNNVIGNSASGGWAGFAFPNLPSPIGLSRNVNIRPSSALPLTIDGNCAHSTGFWWRHAGGFYFGGALWYEDDILTYDPGRNGEDRNVCGVEGTWCQPKDRLWSRLTNTKSYLNAGAGLNSWSGRMELVGFESHDNGISVESLSDGFWIDNMLSVCRSGEPIGLPPDASITRVRGDGFQWYDTAQSHIITDSTFRNCGYRSDEFDQYDSAPNRGCGDESTTGCSSSSSVWGFLTHSDQFNPEVMQGTRGITMDNVGRRFYLRDFRGDNEPSTSSGRTQNWLDVDGSVSGLGVPTLIGSGLADAAAWWTVDDRVLFDPQGPLTMIRQDDGPERNLAHVHLEWDDSLHNQVGSSICGNGSGVDCPYVGLLRHRGPLFKTAGGLPVTAPGDVAGLTGGYGWYLSLDDGAPVLLKLSLVEVDPSTPMLFSLAYPPGTAIDIRYVAGWCTPSATRTCEAIFTSVGSIDQVRAGLGNVYHMDAATGVVTVRVVMTRQSTMGSPDWDLADWDTAGFAWRGPALDRFERDGVLLPKMAYGPELVIAADCASSGGTYCNQAIDKATVNAFVDDVCPVAGMQQVSYDKCCDTNRCVYANGNEE